MIFWRLVQNQGWLGSGPVKKPWSQCQKKLLTSKILALEKQICWQLQRLEILEWNTKTENKKLYAVTLYIECELEFLNLFLCVLFSILSIEYHVNYFKSPYFSVPLKFHVTFVYLCHVFFKIFSLHLTCLGIVAKNLSVIIMSDHKNIKKEKPIVRLNEIIRIIVQMQCSMIDVHILLAIKWPNSSKNISTSLIFLISLNLIKWSSKIHLLKQSFIVDK